MLMIITAMATLNLSLALVEAKWLWTTAIICSFSISIIALPILKPYLVSGWTYLGPYLAVDVLTAQMLILTCWLFPLSIMASQSQMLEQSSSRQRNYLIIMTSLQTFLILAFTASDLVLFFIMFEATLIPTLVIITRWGNQSDRLMAGIYFLFYTLMGSLPLLVGLMMMQNKLGSLSILFFNMSPPLNLSSLPHKFWWVALLMAFLVKMPLYGVHLWLPKAHVEAPVAGSMYLAGILLKLGGYGMMRILTLLQPETQNMHYPFMILALWGVVMTGLICLRQTDLKSLIAYSSVSHMGLVIAAILTQTPWAFTGGLILMIAHGLTSSALFCLANTNYERTHTRTILLTRGLQMALPLMATWWFIVILANLALPPLPNLAGELLIITALFGWSWWTLILTGPGTLVTVAYSLHMFLATQRGNLSKHLMAPDPSHTREHLAVMLHLIPILLIMLKPEILTISSL
nr:NADH dehydrogenase subunit 4 [Symphurus arawak]